MVASRFFVRWIPTGSNMNLFDLVVYIQHLAGWRSLEGIVKLVGELFMFSLVSFSHNFSYSAHAALVEDFFLQPRAGRVCTLLQVAEVGVLLLLSFPFFTHSVGTQVFPCCCLDVSHQLCIAPVRLLLPFPPLFLLLSQSILLSAGLPLLISGNDGTMERTLEAVLSLTQLSVAQWSTAVMVDRSEAPREGDASTPALCQELLVLHLLYHINGNPELMLRGHFDDLASVGLFLAPVVQVQTKWNHRSIDSLLV